jgi:hypothetical protein
MRAARTKPAGSGWADPRHNRIVPPIKHDNDRACPVGSKTSWVDGRGKGRAGGARTAQRTVPARTISSDPPACPCGPAGWEPYFARRGRGARALRGIRLTLGGSRGKEWRKKTARPGHTNKRGE